jgi:methionine-rich copper-binding protein CopC
MKRRIARSARTGGVLACLLALVVVFALPAASAQLAPEYQESDPNAGASLASAPSSVSITFNEPLDDGSTMSVHNSCGKAVDGGNVSINLNEMSVAVTEGHYSGTYKVKYSAVGLGEVTGTTEGDFTFDVAEGHPCKKHHDHDPKKHDEHDPKKHDDHDKKHEHDDEDHENHEGMGHDDDHIGSGHSGTTHTDHSSMSGSAHTDHNGPAGHEGHSQKDGSEHVKHGSGRPAGDIAAPPIPELPADGQAVLVALALCAVMGVIGGVFLRTSTD